MCHSKTLSCGERSPSVSPAHSTWPQSLPGRWHPCELESLTLQTGSVHRRKLFCRCQLRATCQALGVTWISVQIINGLIPDSVIPPLVPKGTYPKASKGHVHKGGQTVMLIAMWFVVGTPNRPNPLSSVSCAHLPSLLQPWDPGPRRYLACGGQVGPPQCLLDTWTHAARVASLCRSTPLDMWEASCWNPSLGAQCTSEPPGLLLLRAAGPAPKSRCPRECWARRLDGHLSRTLIKFPFQTFSLCPEIQTHPCKINTCHHGKHPRE